MWKNKRLPPFTKRMTNNALTAGNYGSYYKKYFFLY